MNNALATKINVFLIAGMKFDDSPGSEPYDVQFVKWMTREKVYCIMTRCIMCVFSIVENCCHSTELLLFART